MTRRKPTSPTKKPSSASAPTSKPSGQVPANKGRRLPPEPLTLAEVNALIKACSNRAPTGIRNRAMLVICWRGGLRIEEALALKPADLDTNTAEIRVLHGKGDRSRVVALDAEAMAVVMRWLDRRRELGINGRAPIICTLAGEPVQSAYVRGLMKRLAERAGITKRVHVHGLRHTFAIELAREGVPVPVISKALGHASVATTSVYLQHVGNDEVVKALRKRTWAPTEPSR